VDLCGSFLTVQEETVYFIHQSAKDYFSTGKGAKIFPSGQAEEHCKIVCRSLQVMSDTLKRDIYGLQMPGALLDELNSVNQDPLSHIRYTCCYWVGHLRGASYLSHDQIDLCDSGKVHIFFQKHFLHWLEALSLIGNISDGLLLQSPALGVVSNVYPSCMCRLVLATTLQAHTSRCVLSAVGATSQHR
jgi:hypothetical protein